MFVRVGRVGNEGFGGGNSGGRVSEGGKGREVGDGRQEECQRRSEIGSGWRRLPGG